MALISLTPYITSNQLTVTKVVILIFVVKNHDPIKEHYYNVSQLTLF